jgi:predicted DsbA family dithiol-disulfide isomerase
MKIEIWSDIMCPFCYIGKRKFELALKEFSDKESVQVQWKSFQLDPDLQTDGSRNLNEYLAERKGWTVSQTESIHQQMEARAKENGLEYHFDKAIPANSFNAHRLSHLAAKYKLQDLMEERLFAAYFTEGKNIDDTETLVELAKGVGLSEGETRSMLKGDAYKDNVEQDIFEAQQVGVRGVPFFLIDDKYAVSGAQETAVFLGALNKAWSARKTSELAFASNGEAEAACAIDGNC